MGYVYKAEIMTSKDQTEYALTKPKWLHNCKNLGEAMDAFSDKYRLVALTSQFDENELDLHGYDMKDNLFCYLESMTRSRNKTYYFIWESDVAPELPDPVENAELQQKIKQEAEREAAENLKAEAATKYNGWSVLKGGEI